MCNTGYFFADGIKGKGCVCQREREKAKERGGERMKEGLEGGEQLIRCSSVKADELRKLVTSEQVGAQVDVLAEPTGWQSGVNVERGQRRRFRESTRGQSPRLTSA